MKEFKWAASDGSEIKLVCEYSCTMEQKMYYSDGYEIPGDKKPVERESMVAYVNGEKFRSSRNSYDWCLEKNTNGTRYIRGLHIGFIDDKIADEYEKWVNRLIEEGTSEEVKAYNAKKAAERHKEEIKHAKRIVELAEKQKDIPTREEAMRRRKRYNNLFNEGGEGYVPSIICEEAYEAAKKLLSEEVQ